VPRTYSEDTETLCQKPVFIRSIIGTCGNITGISFDNAKEVNKSTCDWETRWSTESPRMTHVGFNPNTNVADPDPVSA
jgi:hypothetical protein